MVFWNFLSFLGSLVVTGPIGIAIAIWLLAGKSWRLTLAWCVLFGAGLLLVVATKVAFIGWGLGVEAVEFGGFSGHAMRAAAVFPVALFLALRSTGQSGALRLRLPLTLPPQLPRYAGFAAGALLALLITVSRIELEAHSRSEAVTGFLLGLTVAAAFVWQASGGAHLALSRILVALCIPVLLVAPRVQPVPTERWMVKLALYLSGHNQPFDRAVWRDPVRRNLLR